MNIDTQVLAIWGAVTGTIGTVTGIVGVVLRAKQHKKDQPKLNCSSDFSFEHWGEKAVRIQKITARSVGKRPVTVDYIRYYIKPKKFFDSLLRNKLWKNEKYIWNDEIRNGSQITEGKKKEFKIKLPNGLKITQIVKVKVFDQSNRAWRVSWPNPKKLGVLTHFEQLHQSEESNSDRVCKINAYVAGKYYHIHVQWNPTPKQKDTLHGRYLSLKSEEEYQKKLQGLISVKQKQLLSCEIDELEI